MKEKIRGLIGKPFCPICKTYVKQVRIRSDICCHFCGVVLETIYNFGEVNSETIQTTTGMVRTRTRKNKRILRNRENIKIYNDNGKNKIINVDHSRILLVVSHWRYRKIAQKRIRGKRNTVEERIMTLMKTIREQRGGYIHASEIAGIIGASIEMVRNFIYQHAIYETVVVYNGNEKAIIDDPVAHELFDGVIFSSSNTPFNTKKRIVWRLKDDEHEQGGIRYHRIDDCGKLAAQRDFWMGRLR